MSKIILILGRGSIAEVRDFHLAWYKEKCSKSGNPVPARIALARVTPHGTVSASSFHTRIPVFHSACQNPVFQTFLRFF